MASISQFSSTPAGQIIRSWRQLRRMSQLELAGEANISARHLSFVETGRSNASAMTLISLARILQIPMQDQNHLLLAAGYAPRYNEARLGEAEMAHARHLIEIVLRSHEPYSAYVVDDTWDMVMSNRSHEKLMGMMLPREVMAEIGGSNLMRFFFHPLGLRRNIVNWYDLAPLFIDILRRDLAMQPTNARLSALIDEIQEWVADLSPRNGPLRVTSGFALPIRFKLLDTEVTFVSTSLSFSSPLSTALQHLRIETFYPADEDSERKLLLLLS